MTYTLKLTNQEEVSESNNNKTHINILFNMGDVVKIINHNNPEYIGKIGIIKGWSYTTRKVICKEIPTNKQFSTKLSNLEKVNQ